MHSKGEVEMKRFMVLGLMVFLLPLPIYAGWFSTVLDVIQEVRTTTQGPAVAAPTLLINAQQVDTGLPAHWQQFWLNEPVFNTRLFLTVTGKLNAPVIMLVHGLGQNGLRDWLAIVPVLEKNYRVVMLDLPGFGLSLPPKAKLSPTNYAKVLHLVKEQFSASPVVVVGHSMGGAVTLRYSADFPSDVSQIALIDAAGILQRTAFVKHSAIDRLSINDDKTSASLLRYASGFQNIGSAMVEKLAALPDPTAWLGKSELAWGAALGSYPNMNAALSLVNEDFSRAIFEMNKPVTLLWGAKDTVAPLRTGHMLSQVIPHARLKIIPEAGHNPISSHSQLVADWLLNNINNNAANPMDSASIDLDEAADFTSLNQGDFKCDKQSEITLIGRYSRISLNRCKAVVLRGVEVDELIVDNSLVEIKNTQIKSALLKDSVVVMTAVALTETITLDGSRVDIAGGQFTSEQPFVVHKKSRIIVSVSKAGHQRYVHADTKLTQGRW